MMTRDQRKCAAHKVNSCPVCIAARRERRRRSALSVEALRVRHAAEHFAALDEKRKAEEPMREFFARYGEDVIELRYAGSNYDSFTVEQLYQHFKTRMQSE